MQASVEEKETIVKNSLFEFLKQHIPNAQFSSIDEIVLSYVVSILEELGAEPSDDVEDVFDAEGFCEMMAAYFPEFSKISLPKVCDWMFQLEASLRQFRDNNDSVIERDLAELLIPMSVTRNHNSSSECSSTGGRKARKYLLSEASDGSCSSDSSNEYYAEEVGDLESIQVLQEMFPALPLVEVRHCLTVAGGDVGAAAQLVLHRQEAGQTLNPSLLQHGGQHKSVVNDEELKSRIIARYSFVDKEDDVREHRPVAPKSEPKKLVRYRDNKIVSMKGERFTEIRREDDDELSTKKSCGSSGNKQSARKQQLH